MSTSTHHEPATERREEPREHTTVRGARILVVDDNVEASSGLKALLALEGASVVTAPDGAEALAAAESVVPDVVLTDVRMPKVDGIELCRRLRARDPRVPVILMTSYGDTESAVDGLRAGAVDFLTKPLDFEVVLLSVTRALEERAAEAERERLRAQTEHLYREMRQALRAQDELLSMVVHDLRNPLNAIQLTAHQLAHPRDEAPDGRAREAGELIVKNVRRMKELVDELLDRARVRRGQLRCGPHSVIDVLADIEDLRPLAQVKRVELDVRLEDVGLAVWCDRARVARVFSNLVGNALAVAPQGSTVTVWAESGADGVVIAVKDEGPGIASDIATRIFEPLRHFDGEPNGLGLGLFIAKEIVTAHGGAITLESAPGRGATFRVFLPRRSQSMPALEAASPARRAEDRKAS